jgi:cytochrome c oxidase assembly protein Cox11
MDLLLEGNYSQTFGELEYTCFENGIVTLDMMDELETGAWDVNPQKIMEKMNRIFKAHQVYHINFSSQVYPVHEKLHFNVLQRHIYTSPGDLTLIFFHMENMSVYGNKGVTIYTISPFYLSYYVQKIQCFCFEELRIEGNQSLELPVIFYLDPFIDNTNGSSLTIEYLFIGG